MGVKVTSRKYINKYDSTNTNWLLSNVGDWQKLEIICEFAVEKKLTLQNPVTFNSDNEITLINGEQWGNFGFDLGNNITIKIKVTEYDHTNNSQTTSTKTLTREITYIGGDTIVVDGADITIHDGQSGVIDMVPSTGPKYKFFDAIVYADKQPEGIELTYGIIDNDNAQGPNLSSFVDGTITQFIATDTDTDTTNQWRLMDKLGLQSGLAVKGVSWDYWGKVGTHTYKYALVIEVLNHSFFESVENIQNLQAPNLLFNANSLTDNFIVKGYPKWNNPNCSIGSDYKQTVRLGNTGWFNENFNGLENKFKVESVEYFDENNIPTQSLSYGTKTKLKTRISGVDNIGANSRFTYGFIWLPEDENYYRQKTTPYHENLLINTGGAFETLAFELDDLQTGTFNGFGNARIDTTDILFTEDDGDLIAEITFVPSNNFKALMSGIEDHNYAIWISVGDANLTGNFADRVSLLVDFNELVYHIPPVGEWEDMETTFLRHPNSLNDEVEECQNGFFVEDDVLAKIDFLIGDNAPVRIELAVEMENTGTGELFNLQNYPIDLSNIPAPIYPPNFIVDEIRGFKLENGNNKNWVKLHRKSNLDENGKYGYELLYAFKVRWEDWLSRQGVNSDFYDNTKLNNGYNNSWFNYMNNGDWQMVFVTYIDVIEDGELVRYRTPSKIKVRNYNSNADVNKSILLFRNSDNLALSNGVDPITGLPLSVLLKDEIIRIEVLWQRNDGGEWTDLNDVYATIGLEEYHGAGQMEYRQLSSFWGSEPDNPLKPLEGESKVKLTLVSNTLIKAECLLDTSNLTGVKFKHTARIGCFNGDGVWSGSGDSEEVSVFVVTFDSGFEQFITSNTNFTIKDLCGNDVGVASVLNGVITLNGCIGADVEQQGFDHALEFGFG